MELIDVSLGISPDLPVWPSDPPVEMTLLSSMDEGDEANVTKLAAGVHIGTHVDAPRHFIARGAGVDELPLEVLIGEAVLVSLPAVEAIDREALEALDLAGDAERLLFKTSNSSHSLTESGEFHRNYVAIDESGADWLVERGVRLVGVDYRSVAPWGQSVATHRRLLGAEVVVIEGLDLTRVEPGNYQLYCLPLKLVGADGAPARVLLGRNH